MGKFTTLDLCELCKGWTVEQKAALAHFLQERGYPEGASVFMEQAQERVLYIIASGKISVEYRNMQVELGPGKSFGELSLIHETKKQTTARVEEEAILYLIAEETWQDIRKESPALAIKLLESINKKFAEFLNGAPPPPGLLKSDNSSINMSGMRT